MRLFLGFGILCLVLAPLAQLDRASDYGSEGWRFKSSGARHSFIFLFFHDLHKQGFSCFFVMALHIALTGGIACGKSTAEACFVAEGCRVLDADQVIRVLEAPGGRAVEAIVQRFGSAVLAADGGIDRQALAGVVFQDAEARGALEALLYPLLEEAVAAWLAEEKDEDISIFSAALLFECGWAKRWPHVVCVAASPETQVRRMVATRNMRLEDAEARLRAQMPIDEKMALADTVIFNDQDDLTILKQTIHSLVTQWREGNFSF